MPMTAREYFDILLVGYFPSIFERIIYLRPAKTDSVLKFPSSRQYSYKDRWDIMAKFSTRWSDSIKNALPRTPPHFPCVFSTVSTNRKFFLIVNMEGLEQGMRILANSVRRRVSSLTRKSKMRFTHSNSFALVCEVSPWYCCDQNN